MKLQVPALPVSVAEDQTELIEIRSNIKRRRSFAPQAPRVIKTPEQMRVERANINAYWRKVEIQSQGNLEIANASALVQAKLERRAAFNKLHHRKAGTMQ